MIWIILAAAAIAIAAGIATGAAQIARARRRSTDWLKRVDDHVRPTEFYTPPAKTLEGRVLPTRRLRGRR